MMNLYQLIEQANNYLHIAQKEKLSFSDTREASKELSAILALLCERFENFQQKKNRKHYCFWVTNPSRNLWLQTQLKNNKDALYSRIIEQFITLLW